MANRTESTVTFDELCYPPVGVWLVIATVAGMSAAALAPISTWASLIGGVLMFGALGAAVWFTAPRTTVTADQVVLGSVTVPRADIVSAVAHQGQSSRDALGTELDARTTLQIRGWLPQIVHLRLRDAAELSPGVIFSTRHAEHLSQVLTPEPPAGSPVADLREVDVSHRPADADMTGNDSDDAPGTAPGNQR